MDITLHLFKNDIVFFFHDFSSYQIFLLDAEDEAKFKLIFDLI